MFYELIRTCKYANLAMLCKSDMYIKVYWAGLGLNCNVLQLYFDAPLNERQVYKHHKHHWSNTRGCFTLACL